MTRRRWLYVKSITGENFLSWQRHVFAGRDLHGLALPRRPVLSGGVDRRPGEESLATSAFEIIFATPPKSGDRHLIPFTFL